MTARDALDTVVAGLRGIDARLSGDDSPLESPWDEIKEQLQHGLSPYWPVYLQTIQQFIAGLTNGLGDSDRGALMTALKCATPQALERKLLQRLLARGKREQIEYSPFDFEFFSYPLLDFTVYGQILRRTGLGDVQALVFSAAAPYGEQGIVDCGRIESILSPEQFEAARALGWPVRQT